MDRNPQQKGESDCSEGVKKIGSLVIGFTLFWGFGGLLTLRTRPMGELGHFTHDFGVFSLLFLTPWGLTTGIGLLRAWRWARISMVVFSGLLAAFGTLAVVGFLFMPNGDVSGGTLFIITSTAVLVNLIPLAIGVRWFIYFTRNSVKAHFRNPVKTQ